MSEYFSDRKQDAEDWCEDDRSFWPRAGLLAYFVYLGIRHLFDPMYRSWFAGITLAFHEMGHIMFAPLGYTMGMLGGSIMQLIVPTAAAIYLLLRQRDYFGLAAGGAWLSTSLWELATYIYDAPREQLALVGFSGNPEHDWSTLLTRWHILNSSDTIAALVRLCAAVTWAASMALGGWLLWRIWQHARDDWSPPPAGDR